MIAKAVLEGCTDLLGPIPEPATPSPGPEHELQKALDVEEVEPGLRVVLCKKLTFPGDGGPIGLLEGDAKGDALPGFIDQGVEVADPNRCGKESRVKGRGEDRLA